MSWEWSHTNEAYEQARINLHARSLKHIQVMAAEWKAAEPRQHGGYEFNLATYETELKRIKAECKAGRLAKDTLADHVWEQAEQYRTCTNGGHMAHCCPFGCGVHMVSFSSPVELMNEAKRKACTA